MSRQNNPSVDVSTLTGDEKDKASYSAFSVALYKTDAPMPDTALFKAAAEVTKHTDYVKKRPNEDEYPELAAFYDAAPFMVKRRVIDTLPSSCIGIMASLTWGDDTLWDLVFDSPNSAYIDIRSVSEGPLLGRLRPYVEAAQYLRKFEGYCYSREDSGRPSVNVKLVKSAPPKLKGIMLKRLANNMGDYSRWSDEIREAVPDLINEFAAVCPRAIATGMVNSGYLRTAAPEFIAGLPDSIRSQIKFKRAGHRDTKDELNELVKFGLEPTDENSEAVRGLWQYFKQRHQANPRPAKRAKRSRE